MKRPSRESKSEIRLLEGLEASVELAYGPGAIVPINPGGEARYLEGNYNARQMARYKQKVAEADAARQQKRAFERAMLYGAVDNVSNGLQQFIQTNGTSAANSPYWQGQAASHSHTSGGAYLNPMPPSWHSFMCGHQIKLESGQPVPVRCTICPPAKLLIHTWPKCGHALSYQEGTPIPPMCQTCANEAARQLSLQAAERDAKLAEERKRREDEKDLRVWLDKQIAEVRLSTHVLDPALPF